MSSYLFYYTTVNRSLLIVDKNLELKRLTPYGINLSYLFGDPNGIRTRECRLERAMS